LTGAVEHAIETIKPLYPEPRTVHWRLPYALVADRGISYYFRQSLTRLSYAVHL
jgi:hypothetical protein